ncbi:MAG: RidA family protein [Burkholderiales bacterium]|nr:RidA family protein [Burkholderiales bacterium]
MTIVRHETGPLLSLATEHGNTVYLAGIVAKNLKADVKGQTAEVLAEIDRLLAKCGSHKSKILQAQIWVSDIRLREPMNEVWNAWVDPANRPPRACVEAKLAHPEALVEVMVIAAK